VTHPRILARDLIATHPNPHVRTTALPDLIRIVAEIQWALGGSGDIATLALWLRREHPSPLFGALAHSEIAELVQEIAEHGRGEWKEAA
jgi:hypothetical protein